MALLTPLSADAARRLGAAYGLDVTGVEPILAGSVNSNFALRMRDGGRAFLRVYEEQGAPAARGEARLLDHLAERAVPTPRPLRLVGAARAGAFIAEHAGKPVAVFPWCEGESLCQRRVTPAIAGAVGGALAAVHVAGASFQGAPESRFGAVELERRLRALEARALPDELAAAVARLRARLPELVARPTPRPIGVIHGDLFRDNVLWRSGSIAALLDFESASRGSAAFDLAVTMLAWCFGDRFEPDLARAMAHGYASVRPLEPDERAAFFDEARFAALRFSVTRITDFELRPAGTGVRKDFRRFVARLEAIERMGPDGARALLAA
jgi:homoserine kinase type II